MEKSGDGQPVLSPGTLEFVENKIQIPTSYDEELNKQRYDQLPVDAHGILQLLMKQLGQPGTSNSIDQVSPLPVSGTEWPENQMPAGFEPLTQQQFGQPAEIFTVDSRSTRTIIGESEISEAERKRHESKNEKGREYKKRKKQEQKQMKSDLEKFKDENRWLKEKLERKPKNTETGRFVCLLEWRSYYAARFVNGSQNSPKVPLWEWIFVVSNLTVELPSAVFDQLSSPHKPLHALMAMAFSLLALVLCVIGLLYKGVKEGITFKRPRGKTPWFYYPSRSKNPKRFGTFADLIGVVSAISQCIVTAVNYDFARRAANSPIKFSLLPTIFALALLCSRILETVEKKASESSDL